MSKSRIAGLVAISMEDARADDNAGQQAGAGAPVPNVTNPEPVVVDAPAPVIADPDTLEADVAVIGEAEADVQTGVDAVAELDDVQQGLEALCVAIEATIPEGGLTPQAAGMMRIAYESYSNRLGEESTIPSMESFGGQTSRLEQTTISLESIRETLTKVWEAIKAILVRVRDAIVSFFKQLVSGAEKLRVRAKAVKEASAKTSGDAKEKEIELGSTAAKIAIGSKVDVSNGAVSKLVEVAESAITFDEAASKQLVADFAKLQQAVNTGERVQEAGELQPPKAFSKSITGGVSTEVLPGNVSFTITVNSGIDKAPTAINKHLAGGWSVSRVMEKATVSDTKVATLDPASIGHIADECLKIADLSDKGKKLIDENGKATAVGLKKMTISKEVAQDKVAGVRADLKAFQKRAAAQDQASTKLLAYAVTTGRAYLAVAEKSLAQYGNTTAVAKAA